MERRHPNYKNVSVGIGVMEENETASGNVSIVPARWIERVEERMRELDAVENKVVKKNGTAVVGR